MIDVVITAALCNTVGKCNDSKREGTGSRKGAVLIVSATTDTV